MDDIDAITPLRPTPPQDYPNTLQLLWKVKDDLIGFWPESAYRWDFFGSKIINRWMFIANSPELVEHVFVKHHDIYQRKSPFMRKALEPLLGDGLFVSDGAVWKQRRALETPAFHPHKLKQFANVMTDCALEWRERWQQQDPQRPILVLQEMAGLTAEILSRTLFGNKMGHANAGKLISSFSQYQAQIKQFDLGAFFGLPDWLPKLPQMGTTVKQAKQIHEIVDSLIQKHIDNGGDENTLLSMLLQGHDPNNPDSMTVEQVRNEAVVILMAGHETTANTLAWVWYLLSLDKRVREKLYAELEQVLAGRTPTFDDVPELTYTRAIAEETLRLYPPVPVLSRQALADDEIQDRKIPAGSIILVVPWLLHRHEWFWDKPHQFIPERFTKAWPKRREKYSYIPFSTGPRVCIGMAFGLTELIICIATLAQQFELSLAPAYQADYECRLTLRPKHALPMLLTRR